MTSPRSSLRQYTKSCVNGMFPSINAFLWRCSISEQLYTPCYPFIAEWCIFNVVLGFSIGKMFTYMHYCLIMIFWALAGSSQRNLLNFKSTVARFSCLISVYARSYHIAFTLAVYLSRPTASRRGWQFPQPPGASSFQHINKTLVFERL